MTCSAPGAAVAAAQRAANRVAASPAAVWDRRAAGNRANAARAAWTCPAQSGASASAG